MEISKVSLQHLCGGHHVAHDRALLHELVGERELVLDRDGARMDGHSVRV